MGRDDRRLVEVPGVQSGVTLFCLSYGLTTLVVIIKRYDYSFL